MSAKNLTTKATIQNLTAELKATFAKKSHLPTKVSDLTNDSNFQTGTQVENAIAAQIGRVYRPVGSVAFANLPALTEANLGKVVNVTDSFTTTADFVEGAGKRHKAGADVGIIEASAAVYVLTEDTTAQAGKTYYADANGTALDTQPAEGADISAAGYYEFVAATYKYNVFANFVDTSGQMDKIVGGTTGGLVKQTADGGVEDTGVLADDIVTKVSGATAGNFAGLDANGKLTDSGKKAADFVERAYNQDESEDVVLHASDISDYTAAEIAALLADDEVQAGNGEG